MVAPARLPSPAEMIAHLDRVIEGQERAKRDLACAVYWHYLGLSARDHNGQWPRDYGRQHVLMLGPTGSGKSYMVRTLADWMGVPYVFASATAMVESGYVGDDVETPMRLLLAKANGDAKEAASGLVVLDEVDKIRRAVGSGRDISGEGVQNALLTILDGTVLHLTSRRMMDGMPPVPFDTSRTLIVATGAFVGLAEIVARRRGGQRALGFRGPAGGARNDAADAAVLDFVTADDLVAFGMIPEFIGRFGTISATRPLDRNDLAAILTERDDSPLARCRAMFALHGIDLQVTRGAIEAIAERALAAGTGARGLNGQLRRALDSLAWQLPDLAARGIQRVVVQREVIEHGTVPCAVASGRGRLSIADILRRHSIAARKPETRAVANAAAEEAIETDEAAANDECAQAPPQASCREQTTMDLPSQDPIALLRARLGYRGASRLARWRWRRYEGRWWADESFRTLCESIARTRLGVQGISSYLGTFLEEPPHEVTEVVNVLHEMKTRTWHHRHGWVGMEADDDPEEPGAPQAPPPTATSRAS